MQTLPDIYQFTSLADYLKAVSDSKKRKNPRWSLTLWSKKLSLQGSGTLSNIISGRRIPVASTIENLKIDLGLSEYECEYFDALVTVSSKTTPPQLQVSAQKLIQERAVGKDYVEISAEEFKHISSPLALILIESAKIKGVQMTATWINQHLTLEKLDSEEIENTLDALTRAGLIQLVDGKHEASKLFYKTPSDDNSENIRQFYEASMKLNLRAVREIEPDERHFNAISFCTDSKRIDEMKKEIHAFSKHILQKYDQPSGDTIYQLHTQLVPHLKESNA